LVGKCEGKPTSNSET